MHISFYDKIANLPDDTVLWPGHEVRGAYLSFRRFLCDALFHSLSPLLLNQYTAGNLAFALRVAPGNASIAAKVAWTAEQRAAGKPTVPSTVGAEKEHNVFLRCGCGDAEVEAFCGLDKGASVADRLGALRSLKDSGK